jgi:hypothetical protein
MYLFQNDEDDDVKYKLLKTINKIIELDYDVFQKQIYE